jgi:serine/threonine-protein kinase RsbW
MRAELFVSGDSPSDARGGPAGAPRDSIKDPIVQTPSIPPVCGERNEVAEPCWTWRAAHVIPSDAAAAKRILDEVLRQLRDHKWSEHDVFGIHLAMEEALVNAIKHGNRLDSNKVVHVMSKVSGDRVFIQITDEGAGFDPTAVPDCTDPENLEVPSGRGLMLMRNFMSRIEFNDVGNSVALEKQRSRP